MHPREFFGKLIKNGEPIKTSSKVFLVDTMAIKDFYLKIKIANLRKTLAENTSLNQQLCLDPKTHADVFDVKNFIKCLEDIAEVEQKKMKATEEDPASPGSASPDSSAKKETTSPPKSVESKSPKAEAINFTAKNNRKRQPKSP